MKHIFIPSSPQVLLYWTWWEATAAGQYEIEREHEQQQELWQQEQEQLLAQERAQNQRVLAEQRIRLAASTKLLGARLLRGVCRSILAARVRRRWSQWYVATAAAGCVSAVHDACSEVRGQLGIGITAGDTRLQRDSRT
jgi:hypothetical protein